jgi:replication factor A1
MSVDLEARVKSLEDTLQRLTQALIAAPQPTPKQSMPQPKPTPTSQHQICSLQDGMKKIHVAAKVMEKSEPREVTTGHGPTATCYAEIADETGRIKLSLWGEQCSVVREGDNIEVENGYISSYKGELQLNVGKYGKLTVK